MNPDTNRFEELTEATAEKIGREVDRGARKYTEELMRRIAKGGTALLRPDGSPVPEHWSTFKVGESVVVKNYTFKVAHIGEAHMLLEPAGPVVVGDGTETFGEGRKEVPR